METQQLSLPHLIQLPAASQPEETSILHPTILALHGRGSNEEDLLGLSPHLPPELFWISPRAPLLLGPGSYEWYRVRVIGVPDPKWGEAVKAVVVTDNGSGLSEAEVIAFAADHLAGYKKPKSVDFVPDLPKTTYGKIDKKAIRAPYWEGRDRMV